MTISYLVFLALAAAAPAPAAAPEPTPPPPRVLTLEEALDTARAQQPQIRQAAAGTDAARARADAARASLRPQVSGSADYERTTANFTSRPGALPGRAGGGGTVTSWDTFNYYNVGLTASVLLYDFGQSSSRWKSAEAGVDAQRDSEHGTLEDVFFAVRTAYLQACAAKGFVKVAEDTLANREKHLQQIEAFVEIGTRPEIDLAQARTDRANAQVQLINAENDYESAKAQLDQAMGADRSTDYDVADDQQPPVEGESGDPAALLAEALGARPEVAALANQVRSQELAVRASRAAYGPTTVVSSSVTDAGENAGSSAWNWNATIGISIPVFLGGATRAQLHESEATLASLRAQLDGTRQQVRLEVEQARLGVRAAVAALSATAEALTNARVQLQLAEGRYEAGVGSILELDDAQVTLTSAAQQDVQAAYKLGQARAAVVKALGRG